MSKVSLPPNMQSFSSLYKARDQRASRDQKVPKKPRAEAEPEEDIAAPNADAASVGSEVPSLKPIPMVLVPAQPPKKTKRQAPQDAVDEFWVKFNSKNPGQATTILPKNPLIKRASDKAPHNLHKGGNAVASYKAASQACRDKVAAIVRECRRVNQKYRDPHFDMEFDLKYWKLDCLTKLVSADSYDTEGLAPKSVKRVTEIFENPKFFVDGVSAGDIRQGADGDCWFMAAVCTLTNMKGLVEKVCVARDEQVGVYGFVFHRDGEWISEVIDDRLYLTQPDYDESWDERNLLEDRRRVNSEEEYRKLFQTNSGALYFAQCEDPNETWLPLLEKAYAKAHGDYAAIAGGFTGEGLEDLTGGVTTELFSSDILDKEYFWKEEVSKVNQDFLFGCSTGIFYGRGERKGIYECHAYSLLKAVEIDGQRLCLLRNPWGQGEWHGPWSDGSKEWTTEWMQKLNHQFGDDGAFWMSYDDMLKKYQLFDRTRLFTDEWRVTQQWATLHVPWYVDYHDTKFSFTLDKKAPVVIVLSQLDDRYFCGLEGRYRFELSFRVHKAGEADYVTRSHGNYWMRRSVTAELELEPGEYHVLVKIKAEKMPSAPSVEQMIRDNARTRPEKLSRIGLAYDLAHAKGEIKETAEEKKERKKAEADTLAKEKAKKKEDMLKEKRKQKHNDNRQKKRDRALRERNKIKEKSKAAKKAEKEKAKAEKESKESAKAEETKSTEAEKKTETVAEESKPTTEVTPEAKSGESTDAVVELKASEPASGTEAPKPVDTETSPVKDPETAPAVEEQKPATEEAKVEEGKVEGAKTTPAETPAAPVEGKAAEKPEPAKVEPANPTDTADSTHEMPKDIPLPDPAAPAPDIQQEAGDDDDDESVIDSNCSDISSVEVQDRLEADKQAAIDAYIAPIEEELDEFEQDPWNAIATVGLKVYSKEAAVTVKVVRPRDRVKEEKETPGEVKLDVDDSAADATKLAKPVDAEKAASETSRKDEGDDSSTGSVVVV